MPVATSRNANLCDSSLNYFDLKKLVPFYEDAVRSAEKKLSPAEALYEACSHIPNVCKMTPKELGTMININTLNLNGVINCFSQTIMHKKYYHVFYKPIDKLVSYMVAKNKLDKTQLDQAFDKLKNSYNAKEAEHYEDMERSGIKQFTYDLFAINENRLSHSSPDFSNELTPEKIQAHICNNGYYAINSPNNKIEELVDNIALEA